MLFLGKLTACNFKYSYEKCLLNVLSAVHVSLRNTSVSFLLVILEKSFSSVQVDISLIDQMLKQKGLYSWCVSGNSVEDSSSSTNNLFYVCFPRALKGWQGSPYILYVSRYSHTQKNATHSLGNEYSHLEVTVLMFLFFFFSLLFHVQQCDLIQFMRDHSREYLCVLGRRCLVRALRKKAVWGCGISRLDSLVEKPHVLSSRLAVTACCGNSS